MTKKLHTCLIFLTLTALGLRAADTPPAPIANTFTDAFQLGKFSLDERLRYEYADQENLRNSNAFTLRSLFGFTTASYEGFQGMLEGENVSVIGPTSNYNAAGTNPGGAGRTVIGDPPVTDLNQAWLSYAGDFANLKVGRQRIMLDNQRFIGDANWRQNIQTFDAASLTAKPLPDLTAYYSYVWRVSRVFGNKAPQPDFSSRSHLINVSYSGLPYGTLTGYAYLLDFKNSAPNSSDTYGASFAGSAPVSKTFKITYRAEAATQSDAGNNPIHYTANYYLGEFGGAIKPFDFLVGYEVLGSDDGRKGFSTPLASSHPFNGWVGIFGNTPANGVRDFYLSAGVKLPGEFPLKMVYHSFESDFGDHNYGNEWDLMITHKIGKNWSFLVEGGQYKGKAPFFDTNRLWFQTEFIF